ncbi:peptide deformylase [Ereboglobus sp. PH5-10]|uniref:peptide deformylase n=1 Tax=Ereboglobus sp. PH5-10 TaxID=2940629 RepID=UPI0024072AE0|nr:peptide deformylase [Ereboglobus sp. PH5-10]MDF9826122.1 peptide deformylase [Ereboglobus sp. PH5-10]
MLLPIVQYNDPVLRKKGVKIDVFDAPLATLARDMVETMHAAPGIGLAAQQIGKALQLCVVDVSQVDDDFDWELDGNHPPLELIMPMVIVNPEVKVHPVEKEIVEEGCLSFPDIRGDVERRDEITVKYQDAEGVPHLLVCNGMFARCIQHEVDHLNGVLFIDRMSKKTRGLIDKKLKTLAAKTGGA